MGVARTFPLKSYTNDQWTNIVGGPLKLSSILITNTTGAAITVSLQVSGIDITIMADAVIDVKESFVVSLKGLPLQVNQMLQMKASAAGIHALVAEAI